MYCVIFRNNKRMNGGAVEKRPSAALRCKPHLSTYIHIRLAVRFFARLASEHF